MREKLVERNGTFYVAWWDDKLQRTERKSLKTTDAQEARRRFAKFLLDGDDVASGGVKRVSVSDALDAYCTEHVRVKCADVRRQEIVALHLKRYFKGTPLGEVGIPECHGYKAMRLKEGVGEPTIRRELSAISAAARHALRWRRITAAELPSVELPPDSEPRSEWYRREELERILSASEPSLRDWIMVAYMTGGRRESIERLHASQIDLVAGRINLALPSDMKTKKRRPIVPLFPEIRGIVERRMANGKLFPERTTFFRPFWSVCTQLGFPENKRHPHLLRHSRATHLLLDGRSIYEVAKLLGDTVQTVEKTYGHHSPEFLATLSKGPESDPLAMFG